MGRRRTGWRRILPGLWLVVAVPATAWTVTALWFQSPLPWRGLWIAVAIAVATAIPVLTRGRPRLRLFTCLTLLTWEKLTPLLALTKGRTRNKPLRCPTQIALTTRLKVKRRQKPSTRLTLTTPLTLRTR